MERDRIIRVPISGLVLDCNGKDVIEITTPGGDVMKLFVFHKSGHTKNDHPPRSGTKIIFQGPKTFGIQRVKVDD